MKLKFRHRFEAAHRFINSPGKCSTPHGHSWWMTLTIETPAHHTPKEQNFTYDFFDLKQEWRAFIDSELDHHFFINSSDPLSEVLTSPPLNIKKTPGDPTTELLACLFFKKAESLLSSFSKVKVLSVLLEETPTNSVEVFKEDVLSFPAAQGEGWWS